MDRQLILDAMTALNASPQRIQLLRTMPFQQAVNALEAIKIEAHKLYKKMAFEWHPDRNPDDPSAEDRFKALGLVLADLEKLSVRSPPRPVRYVQYVYFPSVSPFGSSVTYTTTSTSPTSTVNVAWVKVG